MISQPDFAEDVDTRLLNSLGNKLYGDTWPHVLAHNVRRMKGDDPSPLAQAECDLLVNGLRKLLAMLRAK